MEWVLEERALTGPRAASPRGRRMYSFTLFTRAGWVLVVAAALAAAAWTAAGPPARTTVRMRTTGRAVRMIWSFLILLLLRREEKERGHFLLFSCGGCCVCVAAVAWRREDGDGLFRLVIVDRRDGRIEEEGTRCWVTAWCCIRVLGNLKEGLLL